MYSDMCEIIQDLYIGSVSDVDEMIRAGVDVLVPLAFLDGSIWDRGFRGEIIYCPVTDGDVLPDDVIYMLVEMIVSRLGRKKVGLFCAGGHGRTGYVAACVLSELGVPDPIGYLRSSYSPKAVETEKQAQAVFRFIETEKEVERLIRKEAGPGGWIGYSHSYWQAKKKILKERFGIEWKSPADNFPGVLFD